MVAGFLRQLPEALLTLILGDAAPQLVIHEQHLEIADPSAIAAVEAKIAALSLVVNASRLFRQSRRLQLTGFRHILFLTARADPPQQPLRNDAAHAGSDEITGHAHVPQTIHSRYRILGVNGGDHQMTGHGRPHGNFRCLTVSNLSHTDDIRILSKNGSESGGEGQSQLLVDLHLRCPGDIVLHGVLQCNEIGIFGQELIHQRIHGAGLSGAGGAHDHNDAGTKPQKPIQLGILRLRHADAAAIELLTVPHQNTNNNFLAVNGRQCRHTEIHLGAHELQLRPAVLGHPTLHNVQLRHDLQSGNDGILEIPGDGENPMKLAVNTHADHQLLLARFPVNVGGILPDSPFNDGIHQPDGRSIVLGFVLRRGHRLRGNAGLRPHLRHSLGSAFIAIQGIDGPHHSCVSGDHGDNFFSGDPCRLLLRHEVHGVRHSQIKNALHGAYRHHLFLLREVFRQKLRHFRIDVHLGQVNVVDAQLHAQGINQLCLRDESVLYQYRTETLIVLFLKCKGLLQLLLIDESKLQQHLSQSLHFHGHFLPLLITEKRLIA